MNYFIQINRTRQNEDYPWQWEVAALSFQSHTPEEITLSEQTLLTRLCGDGEGQYRGTSKHVKKCCLASASHPQKLYPHLFVGLCRATAARQGGTRRLLPPTASCALPRPPFQGLVAMGQGGEADCLVRPGTDPCSSASSSSSLVKPY